MKTVFGLFGLAAVAAGSTSAVTITDGSASVTFDSGGVLTDFIVGGVDQVGSHTFALSGNDSSVAKLDAANFDGAAATETNEAFVSHTLAGYTVLSQYVLESSNDRSASISLTVTVSRVAGNTAAFDIDLYELANFDLGGDTIDSFVQFQGPTTIVQAAQDAMVMEVIEEQSAAGNPQPNGFQVGLFDDVEAAVLAGSLDGTGTFDSAGNLGWTLAWLDEGGTGDEFILSKLIQVTVPTPGAAMLLAVAGVAGARRRRR